MGQETITVPEFYPDPRNPDVLRRWDGSEDAWTWKVVLDLKRDGAITAAAVFYRHTRDWSTVTRLLNASGWAYPAEDFIEEHREEIKARSRVL